jgi:hypothetical protein
MWKTEFFQFLIKFYGFEQFLANTAIFTSKQCVLIKQNFQKPTAAILKPVECKKNSLFYGINELNFKNSKNLFWLSEEESFKKSTASVKTYFNFAYNNP